MPLPEMLLSPPLLGLVSVSGLAIVSLIGWNRLGMKRLIDHQRKFLLTAPSSLPSQLFHGHQLEGLPPPVARYFRFALLDGQPLVRTVRLTQQGEFRTGESERSWQPLRATQYVSIDPVGFLWDAQIQMAPFLCIRVQDSYIQGVGTMRAKLLSAITLVNEYASPDLARGALLRYLAEAVWFPTALLPSERLQWTAIDDQSALATLTDGEISVSLEFYFAATGEVVRVHTAQRPRAVGKEMEETPWTGYFYNYQARNGLKIPIEGTVEWHLPSGRLPYWRAQINEIEYDLAGERGQDQATG